MSQSFEINITSLVPDSDPDLGHEAVVQTRKSVNDLIELIGNIGLTNATKRIRLIRGKRATPVTRESADSIIPDLEEAAD